MTPPPPAPVILYCPVRRYSNGRELCYLPYLRIVIVIVIVIGGLKSRGLAKHIKMALKIFLL